MTGPDKRRGRLCLTFDNMGSAHAVGIRSRTDQDPEDESLSVGYPRLFDLLDRMQLRATFFIEGWNAIHNRDLLRHLVARGHEIGVHGWVHEVFASCDPVDAARIMADSVCAMRAIGIEPVGFRAPGGLRGAQTEKLMQRHGLFFDSSVDTMPEDPPGRTEPFILPGGTPSIPWLWHLIDYYQYEMHPDGRQSPAAYASRLSEELDRTIREDGVMTPIFHAFVSCLDDERFAVLEDLLENALARGVEVISAGALALETKAAG